jgi:hypothetical protein
MPIHVIKHYLHWFYQRKSDIAAALDVFTTEKSLL